jgi:SAM-dependent methyltransferase
MEYSALALVEHLAASAAIINTIRTVFKENRGSQALSGLAIKRFLGQWSWDRVRWGGFRRLTPISGAWGFDRGLPVDRYYIENFLAGHADDIQGHVLEIMDAAYTRRFGGKQVQKSDVLDVADGNPNATIVADLTSAEHIPSETFDCIIFTQTLLLIYQLHPAIETLHRILKPGGVVLGTVPGITKISREDMCRSGQYWSFTTLSIQRLFEEVFPAKQVEVKAYGNVLTASAFLYGLAAEELHKAELNYHDPDYEMIISVRAVKPASVLSCSESKQINDTANDPTGCKLQS